MGFLLTMAVLWLVFGHWARRSRYACGRGMRLEPGSWRGRSRHGHDVQGVGGRAPPRPVTRESRLELLKRRYVRGELSDEQYEEELDALFRASSVRGRA